VARPAADNAHLMLTVEPAKADGNVRRVESVMGTVVSVAVRAPLVPDEVLEGFFEQLRLVDARFSPYRDDSEVSRLARGEIDEADLSPDLRHVLSACDHLALVTEGAFDARRHRADGRPDPSGYVKGWAIEEAAWLLDTAGARNYWINAGGDVIARGQAAPGQPWRVGIRHPDQATRVAGVLAVSDRAIATSGNYERGEHIRDPRGGSRGQMPSAGRTGPGLRSVTVVGPRLAFTDAYATGLFVMGLDGLRWLSSHPEYEALAITDDDRVVWTTGMDRYLVRG
jgi:thiamine biosynthesis lipoprotein